MSRRPLDQARARSRREVWNEWLARHKRRWTAADCTAIEQALDSAFDAGLAYAILCAHDLRDRAAGESARDQGQRRAAGRIIEQLGGDVD